MPLTLTDEQIKDFIMSWHEARMFAPDFEIDINDEIVLIEAIGAELEDIEFKFAEQGYEMVYSQIKNYVRLQTLTDDAERLGIQLPTDEQQKAYEDEVNKMVG